MLAEGAASLLPGQLRPAVVWTLDLDGTGELTGTDVRRARVRSVRRLDYAGVQRELAGLAASIGSRSRARARTKARPETIS